MCYMGLYGVYSGYRGIMENKMETTKIGFCRV